jgi:gamma-glutamylcyclotransferase (GGCT)/AIG2-like uncharacterized protein YtfP
MNTTNDTLILTDEQAETAIANTPLPTFVYGTLRPGQGNDRTWRDIAYASFDGKCRVIGYRLVDSGFPYALPAITDQAFGCLITPLPERYDECMARMDALEGVPHHYLRETVAVLTPEGAVMAYIYIPRNPERLAGLPEVFRNDWALHQRRKHTSTERWSEW